MSAPLAIDLFCGCFGGTAAWLEAGGYSVGFDLQHEHYHGKVPVGADLVLQDVLTLHGSQFKDAAYIWASPPCQNYSYLAMPWSRSTDPENSKAAKALRKKWETEGPDNRLFDACFRIQREANEANLTQPDGDCMRCDGNGYVYRDEDDGGCKDCGHCGGTGKGRYIPLIVENVRGAVPWVGREKAKFGSFYLWGDVGMVGNRVFAGRDLTDVMAGRGRFGMGVAPEEARKSNPDGTAHPQDSWFRIADSSQGDRKRDNGRNDSGYDPARSPDSFLVERGDTRGMPELAPVLSGVGAASRKSRSGGGWFGDSSSTREADPRDVRKMPDGSWQTPDGTKIGGDWFSDPNSTCRKHGSRSNARKAASAMIAKIPYALSRYIAEQHLPERG